MSRTDYLRTENKMIRNDVANMMVFLMWRGILLSIRTKRLAVAVKEEGPQLRGTDFSGFASLGDDHSILRGEGLALFGNKYSDLENAGNK